MATPDYPPGSRYFGVATDEITLPDGRTHVFLRRRFLPPSDSLQQIGEHTVVQDDRPDHIAYQHFGDPTLFWQLADANDVMHPDELTRPAEDRPRRLRITLPAGVSGPAQ